MEYINGKTGEEIGILPLLFLIMENLKQLDQVAYVRFASVYKDFKDSEQFLEELLTLVDVKPKPESKPRPTNH